MSSTYCWDDFKSACALGESKVQVLLDAERTARSEFSLKTKVETLAFIGSGGVHGLDPDKTVEWRNNPDKAIIIMVDSYNFFASSQYGYLAFMFQPKTSKWILKSFKLNDKEDPRKNTTLGDAFAKAMLKTKELK